jgi:tRNA 2-(methylsulfanyl)-N6-isopentenyladenosine37 hydroxylase
MSALSIPIVSEWLSHDLDEQPEAEAESAIAPAAAQDAVKATIRFLQSPTQEAWITQAIDHLDEMLLDHSHCERKAAGVALNLMFRYPADGALLKALTAIAQEELDHFEQVNQILMARGVKLRALQPAPYGAGLKAEIRRQEPERKLDSLLVAALIEARSHERLGLLAEHCGDPTLGKFYRALMASEARHYGAYWVLASQEFPREIVNQRLEALAAVESRLLETLHFAPRIHS